MNPSSVQDGQPEPVQKVQRIAMALDGLRATQPCILWLGPGPDFDVKGVFWPGTPLPSVESGDTLNGPYLPKPPRMPKPEKEPRWVRVVAEDGSIIREFDARKVDTVLITEAAIERFLRFMAINDFEGSVEGLRTMQMASGSHDWWCRTKASP